MNKILIILALIFLIGGFYFFYIEKNIFYGSISAVLCVVLNLVYAMLSSVNRKKEIEGKGK